MQCSVFAVIIEQILHCAVCIMQYPVCRVHMVQSAKGINCTVAEHVE